jgi:hypothetical protein
VFEKAFECLSPSEFESPFQWRFDSGFEKAFECPCPFLSGSTSPFQWRFDSWFAKASE